ncbi:MAG: glycosyltransferase family 32 protein [Candidatus Rhabdochlamydia sp.]
MARCFFVFIAMLFLCFSCNSQKSIIIADDFESLSGKHTPSWRYVKTKEDFEYLHLFSHMYEQRRFLLKDPDTSYRIPKIIHFIWLGSKPFPKSSVENVRMWMAKHPDWQINFWTDRNRPSPCPGMKQRLINSLSFTQLRDYFVISDNYGEQSDLLRYEILFQEGGIYVDHDVKCFKEFDMLNRAYDFYCGIDMPSKSSLPSCVFATNNLIAAKPNHPILKQCMDLISSHWNALQEEYPGVSSDSTINRVLHRTFWLFGEAVKQKNNQDENQDIVFPAYYFDAPKDELALYARHQYVGSWHEKESIFEKMIRKNLVVICKKITQIHLYLGILAGINIFGFIGLFLYMRRFLRT